MPITVPATRAIMATMANWITIRRVSRMSRPLVEVVGDDQRVSGGVWARQLADGAAPLQLKLGRVASPARADQQLVEAAQRQVEDAGRVAVIAANPILQRLVRPGVSGEHAQ